MRSIHVFVLPRPWASALCATFAMLSTTVAAAATSGDMREAQSVYQKERAACLSGESHQDRATCLKEAAAAFQESRGGRLGGGQGQFDRNRLLRCDAQKPENRDDCVRKINGEGLASGSVLGGGIFRELTTPIILPR